MVAFAPKVDELATRGRKLIKGNAMLVLSRKVGERILIGDQVAVTIVRVSGGGVRVGIEAPAEMAVLRAEIQEEQANGNTRPVEVYNASTTRTEPLPSLEEKPIRKAR